MSATYGPGEKEDNVAMLKRLTITLCFLLLSCAASNASVTYTFADNQAWEESADPYFLFTGTLGFSVTLPNFMTDPVTIIFPPQVSNCKIPWGWDATCGVMTFGQDATGVSVIMVTSAAGALGDDVFFPGATLTQLGSYSYGNASLVITDVPEPATWGLLGSGLLLTALRTRRRNFASLDAGCREHLGRKPE
jgi:hypothetical protein